LRVRGVPVMSMPGDHIAADAAGHGPLGPSHADRERVIMLLKTAFVQGRLTKEELGTRVGQAYTAQTYAELTEVTADLPPGLMGAPPPRQLARPRPRLSMNTAVSAGAFAMLAALVALLVAIASDNAIGVIGATAVVTMVAALAFGTTLVVSWRGRAR
jgi:hypothetical protein